MVGLPWMASAMSVGAAGLMWGGALGMAFMLPRQGGTWLPLALAELVGGVAVSTLLFGACGYLFGHIMQSHSSQQAVLLAANRGQQGPEGRAVDDANSPM